MPNNVSLSFTHDIIVPFKLSSLLMSETIFTINLELSHNSSSETYPHQGSQEKHSDIPNFMKQPSSLVPM